MQLLIEHMPGLKQPPKYSRQGDAGMDLFFPDMETMIKASQDRVSLGHARSFELLDGSLLILAGCKTLPFPLRFKVKVPDGYGAVIMPRSSAVKTGIDLSNTIGLIDSNYIGEVKASLRNQTGADLYIDLDKAFAQMFIAPMPQLEIRQVENLRDSVGQTARGERGFGSSDAK